MTRPVVPSHRLGLLDRRVPEQQVLDPVVAAEVNLGRRVICLAVHRHDEAKAVGFVVHPVTRLQLPRKGQSLA
jgi:hypothetical protein